MAKITLCSDGISTSDQAFTIEMNDINEIQIFVDLVRHGGRSTGLIKPTVKISSNGKEQYVSSRNDWKINVDGL
jgi:hypothetical protein